LLSLKVITAVARSPDQALPDELRLARASSWILFIKV